MLKAQRVAVEGAREALRLRNSLHDGSSRDKSEANARRRRRFKPDEDAQNWNRTAVGWCWSRWKRWRQGSVVAAEGIAENIASGSLQDLPAASRDRRDLAEGELHLPVPVVAGAAGEKHEVEGNSEADPERADYELAKDYSGRRFELRIRFEVSKMEILASWQLFNKIS